MANLGLSPGSPLGRWNLSAADDREHDQVLRSLKPVVDRLTDRSRSRSEATLQADIRSLLLVGDFGLSEGDIEVDLESPAGKGRRIDIEMGYTIIEVKRSLTGNATIRQGQDQLEVNNCWGYLTLCG